MNTHTLAHHAATDCPNCRAAVSGNFCHGCGQETVLHPPSTREFVHEFIGHYVALEGKLWKSLGLLLFRPGRLTLEYINGRRVRYIQPLRLYLTLSLIFFALLQFHSSHDNGKPSAVPAPAASAASAPTTTGKPGRTAELVHDDTPGETHKLSYEAGEWLAHYNRHWGDKLKQFGDMTTHDKGELLQEAFYHYVPYAVFFMMPLFALYLKVLYLGSGRRYGEHLLFALHANGFAFLGGALLQVIPEAYGLSVLKLALGVWLVIYLPMAMRRVYGGSRILTGLRWIVLMLLHLLTLALAMVAAVAFGVVH